MQIEKQRLYRRPDVEQLTGLSRSSIYQGTLKGKFPRPIKIGAKAVAWKGEDLLAWIESREVSG